MNIAKHICLSSALLTNFAISALAQTVVPVPSPSITVIGPATGTEVSSPFTIDVAALTCLNEPVAAMGFSLDTGSDTIVNGTAIDAPMESAFGLHTVHVKAWGNSGAECLTDVGIAVTPTTSVDVSGINKLTTWAWHDRSDPAVKGTAIGSVFLTNFGDTREFVSTYTNYGSELYYTAFGDSNTARNFLYDTWVSIASPNNALANLEMDVNQVTPDGMTIIFGFQCDGYAGVWDYTTNTGTPQKPVDVWLHSNVACNVHTWTPNVWNHVQISYSRDDSGNVTYNAVALNGVVSNINATVPSSFALGWGPTLVTNFEMDGFGTSGTSTVFMNSLSVFRW
jgi:hypothetical protein